MKNQSTDQKEIIKLLEKSIEKSEVVLLQYRKRLQKVVGTQSYVVQVNKTLGVCVSNDGFGDITQAVNVSLFSKENAEEAAKTIPLKETLGSGFAASVVKADAYFQRNLESLVSALDEAKEQLKALKSVSNV